MSAELKCARCGARITLAGLEPGATVQCLRCGALNTVPGGTTSPRRAPPGEAGSPRPPGYFGPRTLGTFVEDTFRTYAADFLRLFAISVIPQAVMFVLVLVFGALSGLSAAAAGEFAPTFLIALIPMILAMVAVVIALSVLTRAALIHAVCHLYVARSADIGKAFKFAWGKLLRLIGVYAVVIVILIVPVAAGVGISVGLGTIPGGGMLAALAWFLFVCVFTYLLIRFVFVEYAVMLENSGVVDALGRSADLVRGHWWRIFGTVLLMGFMISIASLAVAFPLSFILGPIGSLAFQALAMPVMVIVTTLLYLDIRVRKGGYGLEDLARALGIEG
jgi:hypothetical protein